MQTESCCQLMLQMSRMMKTVRHKRKVKNLPTAGGRQSLCDLPLTVSLCLAKSSPDTLALWFLVLIGGFFSTAWRAAFMFPLQDSGQGLQEGRRGACIYTFNHMKHKETGDTVFYTATTE